MEFIRGLPHGENPPWRPNGIHAGTQDCNNNDLILEGENPNKAQRFELNKGVDINERGSVFKSRRVLLCLRLKDSADLSA